MIHPDAILSVMKLIKTDHPQKLQKIKNLYTAAFPACEQKPFSLICEKQTMGCADILYLEEMGQFCGLAITMKHDDIVLLDYFSIEESCRSQGLGSKALQELFAYYQGKRFFLEIESTLVPAENMTQRLMRKKFYLNNQMQELGMEVFIFETQMELLGHNCSLTFQEYKTLYDHTYGKMRPVALSKGN